ncbi:MAG TPA: large conductance mechanosensitive channel protein MscL [Gemmatimonadales bacterium]|jgi:large conductance mechanosensitive channel
MAMFREFKEFAVKGNVMDLAVAVIIGAAFGKIVDSVVNDLIMPVVGRLVGGLDFSDLFIPLKDVPAGTVHSLAAMKTAGVPVFAYGNFLTVSLNFLFLAFIIFQMVRVMNRLHQAPAPAAAAPPPPSEEVLLLRDIRDAVRARG